MNTLPHVCMVGLGYIGLPTAAVMASRGLRVVGCDINSQVVESINHGQAPSHEPDLPELVRRVVAAGMLHAVAQPLPAQSFIIAVPTPCTLPQHQPDISFVESAARRVAEVLRAGNLVILESTSPVGTTEHLARLMGQVRPDLTFPHQAGENAEVQVAYCPERVLPGKVLRELTTNDRLVGGLSKRCAERAVVLYRSFVKGQILPTDAKTAEMAKLAENAFRDVNIAFANELSLLCDQLGVDVWELIRLANRHPRVNILQPGPGVGGHCVAVDPWFLVQAAPERARLIRTAREVNDSKPAFVVAQVRQHAARFPEARIACLGLAFKPDVDDLRESPAVEIVHRLAVENVGRILAVEPHIDKLPAALNGQLGPDKVTLVAAEVAIAQADIVVMLVNHRAFSRIDRSRLQGKIVIDTRGVWR